MRREAGKESLAFGDFDEFSRVVQSSEREPKGEKTKAGKAKEGR